MYLKSLELQGFKSFPDKIRLTFDAGLTAVVGPNGSGKSNIGDAVRWVLGEQSTKTLRGNKMEDVIFSGTKQRRPMGFAAVTLLIDNHSGILGEEYGEEVSVTRKLYRSGESEYRINGKSVRLKDVNELFMDTGMGRDGYSIIGQGRIAEIVSAKSTDRRDIFEEAAGVSKFRYKKEEAQRRLDSAEGNLSRLRDIAAELEGRVEPLRIQAEKAKTFLQLAQQQKELEVSLWIRQSEELRRKLDALENELLQAQAEYQNVERDLAKAEQQVQDGYRLLQESTVKIETLRERIRSAEEQSAQLTAALAVCENERQHALQRLGSLEQQSRELAAQSEQSGKQEAVLLAQEETLHRQEITLRVEIEQAQHDAEHLTAQAAALGNDTRTADEQLRRLYVRQGELRVQRESISHQQEEYAAQNAGSTMRLAALQQEYQTQHQQLAQAQQQLAQAQQVLSDVQQQRKAQETQYGDTLQTLDALRTEHDRIALSIREKQQRKKLLTDMEQNMEGFSGSVKAILRADGGAPKGVHGTVAQCIETEKRCGVAIETALGGAMQNLIVADESAAKQWIRFLAQHRAGRATFLPITSVHGKVLSEPGLVREPGFVDLACNLVRYDPLYSGIVQSLLGRIAVAEDLDAASVIAKKYGYRFRIVTLDGQVINAGGSFTGGSAQRSGGMLTRKTEIAALQQEIAALTQQEQANRTLLETAAQQSQQLRQETEQLRAACTAKESEAVQAAAAVEKLQYVADQAQQRQTELLEQQHTLQQRMQQLSHTLEQNTADQAEITKQLAAAKAAMTDAQSKQLHLHEQQEALAEHRAQLRIQSAALQKDMDALHESLAAAQKQQRTAKEQALLLREEADQTRQLLAEKKQEAEQSTQTLAQLSKQSTQDRQEVVRYKERHDQQSQQIRQLQDGMKEINTAKEKLAGAVTRLEERKLSVQSDYDGCINRLFEQYELTRTEAQQIAKPLEDVSAAQRDLSVLKGKIRALGSVNVSAIEEYEEVSSRWRFLSAQMKDAETAKQELEELILRLTDEMQRIFADSFTQINHNFQEIFRDLFGGGEAELRLTDPEHVLESGIEIHVAPPGKVIKNLISLSGGEQSFVAIAIYFAILRLRPSPFCILDEIDAALDEGNVRKYAQYLRNFTDTTQFILVTHRRSAMEEAKVLYGVTMQENGISRLLRMEQDEFEAETTM